MTTNRKIYILFILLERMGIVRNAASVATLGLASVLSGGCGTGGDMGPVLAAGAIMGGVVTGDPALYETGQFMGGMAQAHAGSSQVSQNVNVYGNQVPNRQILRRNSGVRVDSIVDTDGDGEYDLYRGNVTDFYRNSEMAILVSREKFGGRRVFAYCYEKHGNHFIGDVGLDVPLSERKPGVKESFFPLGQVSVPKIAKLYWDNGINPGDSKTYILDIHLGDKGNPIDRRELHVFFNEDYIDWESVIDFGDGN